MNQGIQEEVEKCAIATEHITYETRNTLCILSSVVTDILLAFKRGYAEYALLELSNLYLCYKCYPIE